MKVSRDYINSEEILDFGSGSFFKLPVKNFIGELTNEYGEPIIPNNPQIAMINAINDPRHRFVTGCLSRRVGKSFISFALGFLKSLEPNNKILIVAPNYSLADIGWNEIKKYIKQFGLKTEKENAKDKEIVLMNGTLIKLASAQRADSAVGRSYDLIVFDEAALEDKGGIAFEVALRPTLDKPNSKAIFISTPRGSNFFKDFYDRGWSSKDSLKNWASVHATWRDNPRASPEDIEQARETNSDAYFRQEYEADFSVFEGRIYLGFDAGQHYQNLSEMDFSDEDEFETIMGIDPGYRDPTAAAILKYNFDLDTFYIVSEYEKASSVTREHAEAIESMEQEWGESDIRYCDSAAAQFIADLCYEYDIQCTKSKKSVNDGINYVASLVEQGKIIVSDQCPVVRDAFINYRWDPKEGLTKEKPLHNQYSHIMDAIRYAIYSYSR